MTAFASIPEILDDLRAGKAIVLVDDESRENEGDFVVAAEAMTVEMINFLTRVGGGYLCVALDAESCERLDLGPQTGVNTSVRGTAFTVTVDGHPKHGVGTGISARDRRKTSRSKRLTRLRSWALPTLRLTVMPRRAGRPPFGRR